MRSFSDCNPIAIAVWFFCVTGMAMFCNYPLLIGISAVGAAAFFVMRNGITHGRTHIFFFILFMILALANPLMSHNGATVLFVLNDNPVTLESLLYGVNSAAMIVGVLYWFRSFTQIMTSEKLLYLTGAVSPKISLVLSMALRFVPLYGKQSRRINDAQTAMGLYKDDNIIDDIRGRMRVFSVLITWALENGIITADSMAARGYGTGRRTNMKRFRFTVQDAVMILLSLALLGTAAVSAARGSLDFTFYPAIKAKAPDTLGICGLVAYFLLILIPFIVETEVKLKWKYLRSGI